MWVYLRTWTIIEINCSNPIYLVLIGQCKECKNFNSMFAIVSGLGHGAVSRLRASWEKLPSKYQRLFSDLQELMDPSRNMSKYRQLVASEQTQPPIVSNHFNVSQYFVCFFLTFFFFFIFYESDRLI